MGFRGQTERDALVGEPEGTSVIKAGVWLYAISGRDFPSSRVAPQKDFASVPATNLLRDRGVFYCPEGSALLVPATILKGETYHERDENPLQDLPERR